MKVLRLRNSSYEEVVNAIINIYNNLATVKSLLDKIC